MCVNTVLAKEKRNKIAQIAMDEVDGAFEAEKFPRGRSRSGWGSCSFGKCARRRSRGKKRFEQVSGIWSLKDGKQHLWFRNILILNLTVKTWSNIILSSPFFSFFFSFFFLFISLIKVLILLRQRSLSWAPQGVGITSIRPYFFPYIMKTFISHPYLIIQWSWTFCQCWAVRRKCSEKKIHKQNEKQEK